MALKTSILNHVLGPIMRGPSSSHSAASLRIGRLCRDLVGGNVTAIECDFDTEGSLATTHTTQGSDLGLIGGLLGWEANDERLKEYQKYADEAALRFEVRPVLLNDEHPNTYRLRIFNGDDVREMVALSTGGGMIEVIEIDGAPVTLYGDQFVLVASLTGEGTAGLPDNAEIVGDGGQQLALFRSPVPFSAELLATVAKHPVVQLTRLLSPVIPVCTDDSRTAPYNNAAEMLEFDAGQGRSLPELALAYESLSSGLSEDAVRDRVRHVLKTMQGSLEIGRQGAEYADRILPSQVGGFDKARDAGTLLGGVPFNAIVHAVTSVLEAKSSMEVIVAAPTAGSCGVVPGALLGLASTMEDIDDEALVDALLSAGIIGVFISNGATFAAEEGGCMAECGSASGMSAAGFITMAGGTLEQALAAASMALQNSFGMTCDTVANRVEAPCLGKNTMAAVNALSSANMALAGYEHLIPLDEVIDAMNEVGRMMPREICCTGLGGIAVTPTSRLIEQRLTLDLSAPPSEAETVSHPLKSSPLLKGR